MAQQSSQLDSEALAWIALASAQRVSPRLWLEALEKYQLPTVELASNASTLPDNVKQLTSQISPSLVDAAQTWLRGSDNRHIIPLTSCSYPESLKQLDSPPLVLFATGNKAHLQKPQIAIVGSRRGGLSNCLSDSG